jgi:hypothetical protein
MKGIHLMAAISVYAASYFYTLQMWIQPEPTMANSAKPSKMRSQ